MPKAAIGEVELEFRDRGPGMPLLLIAGMPAVISDWAPIADPLHTKRRVVAFDNRGGGGSSVTPGPYSIEQLAGDAVGLLDALGIGRADIFGVSLGGMIAQELALRWPSKVDRLILGCTHAGVENAAPQPRETAKVFAMETEDWGERIRALAPLAFGPDTPAEQVEAFAEKKSADVQDPEGYWGQVAAVAGHDTYDRLGDLDAPTLVITGDQDKVIPALSSDVLAERIPASRLEVLPGAGHLFFIEQPERTLELLEDFLTGTPAPG